MIIKTAQIKKLNELLAEKKRLDELVSSQVKTHQDRNNEREQEVERDGKKVKIKEKVLWLEAFHNVKQAREDLRKLYPETLNASDKSNELTARINEFTMREWGFIYNQISLGILINLIIATISWRVRRFFFLD